MNKLIRYLMSAAVLTAALGCSRASVATAQTPAPKLPPMRADTAALRHKLDSIADAHHGIVGYSVIDLDNNVRMSRRGDEKFPTASLIKVPMACAVRSRIRAR